jgi:hypothetical protein
LPARRDGAVPGRPSLRFMRYRELLVLVLVLVLILVDPLLLG